MRRLIFCLFFIVSCSDPAAPNDRNQPDTGQFDQSADLSIGADASDAEDVASTAPCSELDDPFVCAERDACVFDGVSCRVWSETDADLGGIIDWPIVGTALTETGRSVELVLSSVSANGKMLGTITLEVDGTPLGFKLSAVFVFGLMTAT